MTKYTHSHLSAARSHESCVYFSHIPRKCVITIIYRTLRGRDKRKSALQILLL